MQMNLEPMITLDIRQGRIRIYKRTLRLLDRPKYIRLLVNPEVSTLAIQPVSKPKGCYHRIDWRVLDGCNCCELHSLYLVEKLRDVCADWKSNDSYRIRGTFYPKDNIISFNFKDAEPITKAEEEVYE